jgi:hypothetical protein
VIKEIVDAWNKALTHLKEAEKAQRTGDDKRAKDEAMKVMFDGMLTAKLLFYGSPVDLVACQAFLEKCPLEQNENISAAEMVRKAKKFLQEIANLSPPETMLPPPAD